MLHTKVLCTNTFPGGVFQFELHQFVGYIAVGAGYPYNWILFHEYPPAGVA